VAVEDERCQGRAGIMRRRRHASDDRLENLPDAGPLLGAGQDDFLPRDGQRLLQLIEHHLGIGGRQVDLVDDRDDDEVLRHGQMDIGERLGLDALGGVDDQDGALAGLQRSAHLIGEVDVAGRVDQVERVGVAIGGVELHADRTSLDRDSLLALKVHGVEDLRLHEPALDGVRHLEQPIGQGGFPVVDVRDDAEVTDALRGDHGAEV
jgi:hypothetical protein